MVARFDITRTQINHVVTEFYKDVRRHPVIGPIFADHVTNWAEHEEKISGFWANAILGEGSYSGNPMHVHMGLSKLKPEHFQHWLALFDQILSDQVPTDIAQSWSVLAHRIGRGLSSGIALATSKPGEPPVLT